jgi:hypothetical protein
MRIVFHTMDFSRAILSMIQISNFSQLLSSSRREEQTRG